MPAVKKKKTTKKKKKVTKKTKKKFVEKWNEAAKANVPPEKKFKNRGGSKFTLSVNGNKQHDIILDEMQLGGTHKMSGETDPFAARDLYRAVLFFMWGIPLDHPVDKKTDKEFKKILTRLKKEEPKLFLKHETRVAGLK